MWQPEFRPGDCKKSESYIRGVDDKIARTKLSPSTQASDVGPLVSAPNKRKKKNERFYTCMYLQYMYMYIYTYTYIYTHRYTYILSSAIYYPLCIYI